MPRSEAEEARQDAGGMRRVHCLCCDDLIGTDEAVVIHLNGQRWFCEPCFEDHPELCQAIVTYKPAP